MPSVMIRHSMSNSVDSARECIRTSRRKRELQVTQATEPHGDLTDILRGEELVDMAGTQARGGRDLTDEQPSLVSCGDGPVRSHWTSASRAVVSRSLARGCGVRRIRCRHSSGVSIPSNHPVIPQLLRTLDARALHAARVPLEPQRELGKAKKRPRAFVRGASRSWCGRGLSRGIHVAHLCRHDRRRDR
jgi:hypothetical protein